MPLTDTHCHLDFHKFDLDRDQVLQRAILAGINRILLPGLNLDSSREVIRLALSNANLFAAIGLHPTEAEKWDNESGKKMLALSKLPTQPGRNGSKRPVDAQQSYSHKIVAIGEIGLDYYWKGAPRKTQQEVLKEQLEIARELELPVVIHCREKDDASEGLCSEDVMGLLVEWIDSLRRDKNELAGHPGVMHSFSGSLKMAERAIDLNFFIGVTGPITYKNARQRRAVIASLPLERLLIETDSPFQAPEPQRGLRNEPAFVGHIADKIAEIHMRTREQVAEITSANASRLFGWGG